MDEIKKLQKRIRELEEENKQQREEISLLHQEQDTQESLEKFAKSISDIMAIHKLRSQLAEAQGRIESVQNWFKNNAYENQDLYPTKWEELERILTRPQILQGKEGI